MLSRCRPSVYLFQDDPEQSPEAWNRNDTILTCMNDLHQIGVAISTKDRWDDLGVTLAELERYGLSALETFVMDDGSATPVPEEFRKRFPWVRFERANNALGYVAQRNRLARLLTTKFCLSLDDDSFPIFGALEEASRWLDDKSDAIGLAFPIIEQKGAVSISAASQVAPHPVLYFFGGASLIKREPFLQLGGYREVLEYYCEEPEFGMRAWKSGFSIYSYPAVVVRHNKTPVRRNTSRIARFWMRNELWIKVWHYPFPFFPLNLLVSPCGVLRAPARWPEWRASFAGYTEGLRLLPSVLKYRSPMTYGQLLAYRRLPPPAYAFSHET